MLVFILLIPFLSSSTCSETLSRQRRNWIIDSFEIEEEHPGPFPYVMGKVEIDRKYKVSFDLCGQGVDEDPTGVFTIDKDSGIIYVNKAVDYEEWELLKVRFEARKQDFSIDTRLGIQVTVKDINDNPPRFERSVYKISIKESTSQGTGLLTVLALDRDKKGSPNSTFHYSIKSVSPSSPNTEFFVDNNGVVSFKGCLDYEADYEEGNRLIVVVEATDQGDVVQLSSSTKVLINVEDDNDHPPVISGQTGTGKVKENEVGVSPLRLHVTDRDSINTRAWRARYTIHNDDGGHFKIETDPKTNDGILTVVKPLDYEERATRELTISVENEAPYSFCKVKERTSSGLWKVESRTGGDDSQPHSTKVLVEVEDVNDAPEFEVKVKEAMLKENSPVGTWVEKVTAVDPDSNSLRQFVYKIGHDPAGWMTVDPHSGNITTIKVPDRESPHVVNGTYTVILHAVDDGKPSMTGTGTLQVHVADMNDNIPKLEVTSVDVCVSDAPTTTNISAFDPDGTPFGGPFIFELLGNVQRYWKLDPTYGFTAGLVKKPGVHTGSYTIDLKISDLQGESGVYSLQVTVCTCSVRQNCNDRSSLTTVGYSAAAVAFLSLLVLLLLLLIAISISCKNEFVNTDSVGTTTQSLNTECGESDIRQVPDVGKAESNGGGKAGSNSGGNAWSNGGGNAWSNVVRKARSNDQQLLWLLETQDQSSARHNMDQRKYIRRYMVTNNWSKNCNYVRANRSQFDNIQTRNSIYQKQYRDPEALAALIQWRVSAVQKTEHVPDELHHYEEEGVADVLSDLENIIPDQDEDFRSQNMLQDLGPSFIELASICKPPQQKH